ncbi:MAG TPA: enoyl-CoA hydratase-related protein [Gemmatimonadaceae bacterium]|nr:enoyl-CoA hydratase-related protein [Gemmatimonadaceae bacterium]
MTGSYERILHEMDGAVAILTLNRPEKRNALDKQTLQELTDALGRAAGDDSVRVVLLRAAGPDFCAGADLAQLQRIARGADAVENLHDATALGDLFVSMRRHPSPIVAAVQGNAIAGGAGLATACDLVLAAEDATFGYPEIGLGFVPAMVMALLRRSVGEKTAFELVALGGRFSAEAARQVGLVNRTFPAASLDDAALTFTRDLAQRSASALELIKRLLYGMDGMAFEAAIARGAEVNALARATDDCRAGVTAFLGGSAD